MNATQIARTKIIQAALPDIVFDGWTMDTLEAAAEKAGYDAAQMHAAFEGGVIDALDAFAAYADATMLEKLGVSAPDSMRVRDRISLAVMTRFEVLEPHKEAVKESMKFWLNPLNKPRAAKIVWRSADAMWEWAGDSATDYNRYTKRTLLSGILAPAMLVWLNDHSEDMSRTRRFVEGRIANVLSLGRLMSKMPSFLNSKKEDIA